MVIYYSESNYEYHGGIMDVGTSSKVTHLNAMQLTGITPTKLFLKTQ